jgi:adenosylhomocysteine nucleosidase
VRLGIVTGLDREAACLGAFGAAERPRARCFGAGPRSAEQAATELIADGCEALLSFGFVGGLDARLRPGSLIVANGIVAESAETLPTDDGWRQRLLARLSGLPFVYEAPIAGCDHPVLTTADKRALAARTAAPAVDMESHAVARAARQAGTPFLAMRAIVDPAERAIPHWLPGIIDGHGRPRIAAVLAGLARNPRDVPALLRLARDQRVALRALHRATVNAGPLFALR